MEPCSRVPYCTSVCMARSSGELIGVTIRSTVRKAARLAVYEEMSIRVKKNHEAAAIRPDTDLGDRSHPCCMKAASENQKEFQTLNSFTTAEEEPPDPGLPAERAACKAAAPAAVWAPGVGGPGGAGSGAPPMMPGGC